MHVITIRVQIGGRAGSFLQISQILCYLQTPNPSPLQIWETTSIGLDARSLQSGLETLQVGMEGSSNWFVFYQELLPCAVWCPIISYILPGF